MTTWIGELFTSELGWDHLEALVDIGNRMAGSEGEQRAATLTADALSDIGARNVATDTFDIQGWRRGQSRIMTDGRVEDCIALPRSPAGVVTGELIDVGYGLPDDFAGDLEGAIVMAASNEPDWFDRTIHRREKYYHAVEAGAAGFIFRNHIEGTLAPTGSVGNESDPIGSIPAVGVSKEVGARLARRCGGSSVTFEVDAETPPATSHNVHADVGPDTDDEVLVTSHLDAHDIAEGAWDNGVGTAIVLEIARSLLTREELLDTRVHLIVYGAEEVGLVGSSFDSDARDHDQIASIVNVDGAGRGRTLKFYTHGFPELATLARRVSDRIGHPATVTPQLQPHSDHWPYVRWGVPGYHVMSEIAQEGRGWGHTAADTLDKVDIRNVREQSFFLTELVGELAGEHTTVNHRDPTAIAEQLETERRATSMKITGDWPYH